MQEINEAYAVSLVKEQKEFFYRGQTRDVKFRINSLKKLWAVIKANEKAIEQALYEDLGKSEFESYATEIGFVLASIRNMIRNLRKWTSEKRVKTPIYLFPGSSRIRREPYGSVLILGPYNYPFQLLMEPLIGAIAAGNCTVLKPSEISSRVSAVIKKIVGQTFDKKYIACIEGGVRTNTILLNQKFDYIFFTGSPRVGKIVMKAAAEHLIPVTLELGGKSPAIIEKSADIGEAAKRIMWGKLMNAGQTCVAPDYILTDEEKKEELLYELRCAAEQLYGTEIWSNPDFGRIINKRHTERLAKILEQDAPYVYYGGEIDIEKNYIGPTILNLEWAQRLNAASMQEELFGAILPVLSYPELEDAVRFINESGKPLALYLFTKKKSIERFVLNCTSSGGVCVNDTISHLISPKLPFGGIGQSGMGQYHGKYSFDTFTHERSVFQKPAGWNFTACYPPFTKQKLRMVKFFLK